MATPGIPDIMTTEEAGLERRAKRATLLTMAGLAVAAVVGIVLALGFLQREKERDLLSWQVRLGLVADSRALDVGRWVEDRLSVLRDLAQNPSVQLYMTNLSLGIDGGDAEQVEGRYLRNLLDATALREGMLSRSPARVEANIVQKADGGLGLLDHDGRLIAATAGMEPPPAAVKAAQQKARHDGHALVDLETGSNGRPVMSFVVAVPAIQGDAEAAPVGYIWALRPVGDDLFSRLRQPGDTDEAETLLIRANGGQVEYLSPLADGTGPLARHLALDTASLDAAFVLAHPGGFAALRDYRGRAVLATGRPVAGTSWTLLRTVGRDGALADSESRQGVILVVSLALVGAVVAGAWALWAHGSSIRVSRMALRHKVTSDLFEGLLQFMRTLTDTLPSEVVCVDGEQVVTFANKPFAASARIAVTAVKGKKLSDLMGPARSRPLIEASRRVVETGVSETRLLRVDDGEEPNVASVQHVFVPATARNAPGVLTVITDVTDLHRVRERSEARLQQLVATLVGLVDRRDPFAAGQSGRTAEVAVAIGAEMGLEEAQLSTIRFTAELMNIGRIVVPEDVLARSGPLSDAERRQISQSNALSAEIVAAIAFDGPVADSIRQLGERWDGSGPLRLAGEAILLPARIVSVANTFVAMISPRAYREALAIDVACNALRQQEDRVFDRRPVSALVNIVDNRDGRARWAHFAQPPSRPS